MIMARDIQADEGGHPMAVSTGARLRQLRDRSGLTMEELADRLGITRQAIYNMEKGKNRFTLERLRRVTEALGYDFEVRLTPLDEGRGVAADHAERLQLAQHVTNHLREQAGSDLLKVVLYGSVARGEDTPASDVDMIALFDSEPKKAREYRNNLLDSLFDNYVTEGNETLFELSLQVFSSGEWEKTDEGFQDHVDRKGVVLYEREK